MNLLNNRKINNLRLLRFKFVAYRNRDDDDGLKLPEECLKLELFGKVLMALVSINKLFILLWGPTGLNLHRVAEFDFCNFLYPPNALGILRDTIA